MTVKFSALPGVTLLAQTDILPVVANGVTSKIKLSDFNANIKLSQANNDAGFLDDTSLVSQLNELGLGSSCIALPNPTDLNTVVNNGNYYWSGGTNFPFTATSGILNVSRWPTDNKYVTQIFTPFDALMNDQFFARRCLNGVWENWATVAGAASAVRTATVNVGNLAANSPFNVDLVTIDNSFGKQTVIFDLVKIITGSTDQYNVQLTETINGVTTVVYQSAQLTGPAKDATPFVFDRNAPSSTLKLLVQPVNGSTVTGMSVVLVTEASLI